MVANQDHLEEIEHTKSLDHALIHLIDIEETRKGNYLNMTKLKSFRQERAERGAEYYK